jgi:hypothetical protein
MVKVTENPARHTPAQDETLARALLDSNPKTRRFRRRAGRLLAADDPLRIVEKLTPEDRRRLVDRVDQVRRQVTGRSLPLCSRCVSKGVPERQPQKRGVLDLIGRILQRRQATSGFGRDLHGTREAW